MIHLRKIFDKLRRMVEYQIVKRSAYFDEEWYRKTYPEAAKSGLSPRKYYFEKGWLEGHNPNRFFKGADYIRLNPKYKDLKRCHLSHWLVLGKRTGALFNEHLDHDVYSSCHFFNEKLSVPEKLPAACLIAHVYPEEAINQLLPFLKRLHGKIDIWILSDTEKKLNKFEDICAKNNISNINFKRVRNSGRDTSALLIGAKDIVKKYKYFCFVHAKESAQCNYGRQWRKFLWENLLGLENGFVDILETFEKNPDIGLIFPPPFPSLLHADMWDAAGNRAGVEKLARKKLKLKCTAGVGSSFPAGAMFWARTEAVAPMFDADWSYRDLMPDNTPDGAPRHFIERIWPLVAKCGGYKSCQGLMERFLGKNVPLFKIINPLIQKFPESAGPNKGYEVNGLENPLLSQLAQALDTDLEKTEFLIFASEKVVPVMEEIGNTLNYMKENNIACLIFDQQLSLQANEYLPFTDFFIISSKFVSREMLDFIFEKLKSYLPAENDFLVKGFFNLLKKKGVVPAILTPMYMEAGGTINHYRYPIAFMVAGAPFYAKKALIHHPEELNNFLSKLYPETNVGEGDGNKSGT